MSTSEVTHYNVLDNPSMTLPLDLFYAEEHSVTYNRLTTDVTLSFHGETLVLSDINKITLERKVEGGLTSYITFNNAYFDDNPAKPKSIIHYTFFTPTRKGRRQLHKKVDFDKDLTLVSRQEGQYTLTYPNGEEIFSGFSRSPAHLYEDVRTMGVTKRSILAVTDTQTAHVFIPTNDTLMCIKSQEHEAWMLNLMNAQRGGHLLTYGTYGDDLFFVHVPTLPVGFPSHIFEAHSTTYLLIQSPTDDSDVWTYRTGEGIVSKRQWPYKLFDEQNDVFVDTLWCTGGTTIYVPDGCSSTEAPETILVNHKRQIFYLARSPTEKTVSKPVSDDGKSDIEWIKVKPFSDDGTSDDGTSGEAWSLVNE